MSIHQMELAAISGIIAMVGLLIISLAQTLARIGGLA